MKSSLRKPLAKVITFLIVVTLINLLLPSAGVFATPRSASSATGIIRVAGNVTIDGMKGTSGQTLFPGSRIATFESSESIVDLGKFTRLRLLAETDFTLDFSPAHISGTLAAGAVRGFIPAGVPVSIRTGGGELITDPGWPVEFIVKVVGDNVKVSVTTGRVELRGTENSLHSVSAGEVFTTGDAPQTQPDPDNGLTNRQKVGIFAAIGAAATILFIVFKGRDEEEPEFGGCVIILSGPSSGMCP